MLADSIAAWDEEERHERDRRFLLRAQQATAGMAGLESAGARRGACKSAEETTPEPACSSGTPASSLGVDRASARPTELTVSPPRLAAWPARPPAPTMFSSHDACGGSQATHGPSLAEIARQQTLSTSGSVWARLAAEGEVRDLTLI